MSNRALLVGLTSVDPNKYNGWNGTNGCVGCELDVSKMEAIVNPLDFETRALKTKRATAEAILTELRAAAEELNEGDFFFFYFSGHGGDLIDENGDETDGRDETLVSYDREIRDDELNKIWVTFKAGVRIFMVSDSCNSGTNFRNRRVPFLLNPTPIWAIPNRRTSAQMLAQMIHMGGCKDGATSDGYADGGEFTSAFVRAWEGGNFQGNYKQLYQRLLTFVDSGQQPQMSEYGKVQDTFRNQKPFTSISTRAAVQIHPFFTGNWGSGYAGSRLVGGDGGCVGGFGGFGGYGGFRDIGVGGSVEVGGYSIGLNLSIRATNPEELKIAIDGLGPMIHTHLAQSGFSRDTRACSFSGGGSASSGGGWSVGGGVTCQF